MSHHDYGMPQEIHERILAHVKQHAQQGNAQSVIDAIDGFSHENTFMMNVGDEKGPIVDDILRQYRPKVMIELGGFIGYSALRFGHLLKQLHPNGEAKYYSIEYGLHYADCIREMVKFAGLDDVVTVFQGAAERIIPQLRDLGVPRVDAVFLDHVKELYLHDLIRLEGSGVLKKGSVLIADNVIYPGAPDYLQYVRSRPEKYQTKFYPSFLEYSNQKVKDGLEVSEWLWD